MKGIGTDVNIRGVAFRARVGIGCKCEGRPASYLRARGEVTTEAI
jgi:hypothetical protein